MEAEDADADADADAGYPATTEGLYRQDTFRPIVDDDVSAAGSWGSRGSRGGSYTGGGEEDDDDVVDRSARKRQKPLRYRDEEE